MYLLMLLATFVSAIYGYNLSVRSDYDRDIPVKKAKGIIYKFNFQENMATAFLGRVASARYVDTRALYSVWPDDTVFADSNNTNNEDTAFVYALKGNYSTSDNQVFYMRKKNNKGQDNNDAFSVDADDYLAAGRKFYDGSIMVSRIICLDKPMHKEDAATCVSAKDEDGNDLTLVTDEHGVVSSGSCCFGNRYRFLATYRSIDSRWINRVHKGISLDFMKAVVSKSYTDNIGVIHWDDDKGQWIFQGKINFGPVYAKDMEIYEAAHVNDPPETRYYPVYLRNRSVWEMPKRIFDRNFFKDSKKARNICESGCLFKIRYF